MSVIIDNPRPAIQEGNIGTVFIFTIEDQAGKIVDISTATTLDAFFFRPVAREAITRMGVLHTDGTDGKMRYVSIAGDLVGAHDRWRRQGRVVIPGLGDFHSIVRLFPVKGNIA